MKNFSLGIKVSFAISIVILAVMMVATFMISAMVEKHIREIHYRAAEFLAMRYSREIVTILNSPLYTARAISQTFETMKAQHKADRMAGDLMLKKILEENPEFVSTWTTWEPNAYDGRDAGNKTNPDSDSTGRYCPTWSRTKIPVQLEPPVEYLDDIKNSYYYIPRDCDHESVIPPFKWNSLGIVIYETSLVVPIHYKGKFVGIAGVDMDLETIRAKVLSIKPMGTGYATLISQEGKYVAHPISTMTDQFISDASERRGFLEAQHSEVFHQVIQSSYLGGVEVFSATTPIVIGRTGTPWIFQVNIPVATVLEPVRGVRNAIFLLSFVLILIASGGLYFLLRIIILKPLRQVEQYAVAVSSSGTGESPALSGQFQGELQSVKISIEKMVGLLKSRYEELRQRTNQLQESEQKIQLLVQQTPLAIIEWDADFRVVRWNAAAEKIFGYTAAEAAGRHGSFILSDLEKGLQEGAWAQIWREHKASRSTRKCLTKAGCTIICDWHNAPLFNAAGKMVGAVSIGLDVTQQKGLEEQVRQSQKMEAVGTLAGGIAHDFNNILGAIWGYTELCLSGYEPLNPEIKENLEQILKAAQRARDLVKQILTFSRHGEAVKKPIELGLMVKETIKMLRASIPSTIEIKAFLGPYPQMVMADPTQVHQVLMNLCTNAAHAMKNGGGKLTVSLSEEFLTPNQTVLMDKELRPGFYARLTVEDTGPGIRPEHMSRLFEPFFTTKPPGEGTGLGLSVALGIANNHEGTICASSVCGEGAKFDFFLPLLKEQAEHATAPSRHAIPHGRGERILLVDDDLDFGRANQKIIQKLDYTVILKNDSSAALQFFREDPNSIDLVFTDQTMPGMTGINLAAEMLKIKPDLPVILCSGYSDHIPIEEAGRRGIANFLMKPLSIAMLASALENALHNRPGNSAH